MSLSVMSLRCGNISMTAVPGMTKPRDTGKLLAVLECGSKKLHLPDMVLNTAIHNDLIISSAYWTSVNKQVSPASKSRKSSTVPGKGSPNVPYFESIFMSTWSLCPRVCTLSGSSSVVKWLWSGNLFLASLYNTLPLSKSRSRSALVVFILMKKFKKGWWVTDTRVVPEFAILLREAWLRDAHVVQKAVLWSSHSLHWMDLLHWDLPLQCQNLRSSAHHLNSLQHRNKLFHWVLWCSLFTMSAWDTCGEATSPEWFTWLALDTAVRPKSLLLSVISTMSA